MGGKKESREFISMVVYILGLVVIRSKILSKPPDMLKREHIPFLTELEFIDIIPINNATPST